MASHSHSHGRRSHFLCRDILLSPATAYCPSRYVIRASCLHCYVVTPAALLLLSCCSPAAAILTVYSSLAITGVVRTADPNTSASSAPTYDPAALLNPRAFSRMGIPDNGIQSHFFDGSGSSTPVEFTFDSPNNQLLEAPMYQTANLPNPLNSLNPPNGAGAMIERVNNVEHRALVSPQPKRRRLEFGEGLEPKSGFGPGGTGMMGQHMKEKREEHSQAATTQVDMVDLTSGSRSPLLKGHVNLADAPSR